MLAKLETGKRQGDTAIDDDRTAIDSGIAAIDADRFEPYF